MDNSNALVPIDYTSKDFDGFTSSMLSYAAVAFPDWTDRSEADFGVLLVQIFAYMGDILSYYGDRIVNESYIATATQRSSLLKIANMLGYRPNDAIASTGTVTFTVSPGQATDVTVPAHTQVMTTFIQQYDAPIFFETDDDLLVPATGAAATASVTQGQTIGTTAFILHPGSDFQETVNVETLGISDGTPNQIFTLAQTPVIQDSVRTFTDNPDLTSTDVILEYTYFDVMVDATPQDNAFTTSTDASSVVSVQFGDGVDGSIPPAGIQVYATYRVGGGTMGNIGVNAIVDIASTVPGVTVSASSAMTGGADPESNDQIRENAPKAYQAQNRAVTQADYEAVALGVSAVAKARAVANTYTSITIYILAAGGAVPSGALIAAVTTYVNARKMLGTTITVQSASLVPVNIGSSSNPVIVGVSPTANRANVNLAVMQALQGLLSTDSTDFGQRISLSSVYKTIAQIADVEYAAIPLLARADAAQSGTADILTRAWEVPTVGSINISVSGGIG